nr:hypothetical protein [Tanacetum cinerariifolium]
MTKVVEVAAKVVVEVVEVATKVVAEVVANVEANEAVVVEKLVMAQLKVAAVAVARAREDR